MKTTKPNLVKMISQLAMAMLLVSLFSCSEDVQELEEGLKLGKNNNATQLKVIAKGAEVKGTNGIYFGPDDNLYIASFYGQNITVMNKQNGKILKQFGLDQYVYGPDDLVFHPDGKSFYYTDVLTGYVVRMGLDGTEMARQYLAPGANPITFSDDETPRLFVGTCFEGDGLYELDPELDPSKTRTILEYGRFEYPIGILNAFDFGPDGFLYGPVFSRGFVVRVNIDNLNTPSTDPYNDGTITAFSFGFTYPVAAKFGPDGLLTVLDQSGEVFKVNHVTGEKTLFATLQPGLDNLAFDSDGNLFVSSADFGWIIQILPSGQSRTISDGGMIGPQGVAVLPGANNKDEVFVGNVFRMHQINGLTGKEENVYKGYLVAETDKLTMPFSVQADGENLLVSNWFNGLVQVWSPEDDKVVDNQQYQMNTPIDAVRVNGEIVVSDRGYGGVVRTNDPTPIQYLTEASGLATDGKNLWAADWSTGEVWKIDIDGGEPELEASGLLNPEGLAFEKEGSLVVVETSASRLSRIDLNKDPGENVTTIVDGLELSAPALGAPWTWWFDGVAVGPSGDIYVSGGGANVLYRVSP